jgi:hypothetical protein
VQKPTPKDEESTQDDDIDVFLFKNVRDALLKKYHEFNRRRKDELRKIEAAFGVLCDERGNGIS